MEYPKDLSNREMINPAEIGPIIPALDVKIPIEPLKKSRVSGSVISNVKTLNASQ